MFGSKEKRGRDAEDIDYSDIDYSDEVARTDDRPGDTSERYTSERYVVVDDGLAMSHTHKTFGGSDPGAQFAGMLAALGSVVVFAGLVAGAGNIGYSRGLESGAEETTLGGLIAGAVVLLISLLIGGWVAGRMARYDGSRNGFFAGLWFLVILGVVTAIGAWLDDSYNFLDEARLPDWMRDNLTTAGVIAAAALSALCLLAATIGGGLGARYHRNADTDLLTHRRLREMTEDREREVVSRDRDRDNDRDADGAVDGDGHVDRHQEVTYS